MSGMFNPLIFYPTAILMIIFAILSLKLRNIFYSLLSAIMLFFIVGLIFYLLGSEYNAVIQLAIYGVAVPIVLGLAIMFTDLKQNVKLDTKKSSLKYWMILFGGIFILAFIYLVMTSFIINPIGFEISETITKAIPSKESLVTKNGNEVNIQFDAVVPNTTGLSTYYLSKLDDKGTVQATSFFDYWMVANGKMNRKSDRNSGSDVSDVSILTYNEKKYTDFVATFEYQQTWGRLMFLFGSENGKYPLYEKEGHFENGGGILYPEADLGSGGGICALGNVKIATEGYRPLYRELSYAPEYFKKDVNGNAKMGTKYTMTVAVINKHCSVYVEGFGLVAAFDLNDNYKGGYISLASTQTEYQGFTYLNIREVDTKNAIKAVNQNRDITVKTGTALKNIDLPSAVKVTNAEGKTISVPVVWTDRGYDGSKEGEYQFVGTLKPTSGVTNPGMMTALLTVRVRDKVSSNSGATKIWTFDTMSDLMDFKSYYLEDASKGKAVESDYPS